MTTTLKSTKVGNYLVEVYQEKFSVAFHVGLYERHSDGLYRTLDDRTYTSMGSANRRFNTLVRRYARG